MNAEFPATLVLVEKILKQVADDVLSQRNDASED